MPSSECCSPTQLTAPGQDDDDNDGDDDDDDDIDDVMNMVILS